MRVSVIWCTAILFFSIEAFISTANEFKCSSIMFTRSSVSFLFSLVSLQFLLPQQFCHPPFSKSKTRVVSVAMAFKISRLEISVSSFYVRSLCGGFFGGMFTRWLNSDQTVRGYVSSSVAKRKEMEYQRYVSLLPMLSASNRGSYPTITSLLVRIWRAKTSAVPHTQCKLQWQKMLFKWNGWNGMCCIRWFPI